MVAHLSTELELARREVELLQEEATASAALRDELAAKCVGMHACVKGCLGLPPSAFASWVWPTRMALRSVRMHARVPAGRQAWLTSER